ncbi:auxin-responsive protein SAUR66-like [Aristolochia californica]|uniref:auxin-responsive protein SAUR66-like n=1 Tax=Aristolochia californica TaxID=171875 RepID=UPI0035DC9319
MGKRCRTRIASAEDEMGLRSRRERATQKGRFVVYAIDGRRFAVPLAYLNSAVFRELFRVSESEFGLPGSGPITLPCSGIFLEYVLSVIGRRVYQSLEKALLLSVSTGSCTAAFFHDQAQNQQQLLLLLHGF